MCDSFMTKSLYHDDSDYDYSGEFNFKFLRSFAIYEEIIRDLH